MLFYKFITFFYKYNENVTWRMNTVIQLLYIILVIINLHKFIEKY